MTQVFLNYMKTKISKPRIKQNLFNLLGYYVKPCISIVYIHNDDMFHFSKQGGGQLS